MGCNLYPYLRMIAADGKPKDFIFLANVLTKGISYNNPAISYKMAGYILIVADSVVSLHSKDV